MANVECTLVNSQWPYLRVRRGNNPFSLYSDSGPNKIRRIEIPQLTAPICLSSLARMSEWIDKEDVTSATELISAALFIWIPWEQPTSQLVRPGALHNGCWVNLPGGMSTEIIVIKGHVEGCMKFRAWQTTSPFDTLPPKTVHSRWKILQDS